LTLTGKEQGPGAGPLSTNSETGTGGGSRNCPPTVKREQGGGLVRASLCPSHPWESRDRTRLVVSHQWENRDRTRLVTGSHPWENRDNSAQQASLSPQRKRITLRNRPPFLPKSGVYPMYTLRYTQLYTLCTP